ncbi:MAG: hypothetical protein GX376_03690, partial [Firmicutes bacterium]|nr:hypothetical protein [Bacillota bacterium]
VANIHVDQHFKEDSRYLNIKWEEDGKGGRRIFRLWPLHVLGGDYIERAVPDDVCALQIVAPVGQLPPGRYRLEWTQYDPWDSGAVYLPPADRDNCLDIEVGVLSEMPQIYLGKRLLVTALGLGKQIPEPRGLR